MMYIHVNEKGEITDVSEKEREGFIKIPILLSKETLKNAGGSFRYLLKEDGIYKKTEEEIIREEGSREEKPAENYFPVTGETLEKRVRKLEKAWDKIKGLLENSPVRPV